MQPAANLYDNRLWFLVMVGLLFVLLHFGVFKRKERYLLKTFGDPYKDYCHRVRRWI